MKLAKPWVALLLLLLAATATAQTFTDPANLRGERVRPRDGRELPIDQGASGLQQLLRKLSTRASLMLIVAHPDDEDGGMLTLYSRGLGARVAVLTLNRGEGGQNAMTGDFGDALGLLRTQELLSADRYFDVDQMFGTEVDFGFSKTKEESFAKWTHERVLYDAVRAVRLYRPLVIASVFIGGVTDGHGQHQVAGQIAQEVFNAAGDPKVFPELTAEGILPWQPLKVYARVPMQSITAQGLYDYATGQYAPARFTNYVTGEVTTTEPSVDVVVHEGTTDPLLADTDGKPRSYVQFARIGLGLQRSQIGPGARNAPSGAYDIAYHLYGSHLGPSANGAPHTSMGQSPMNPTTKEDRGLKARAKPSSIPPNPSSPSHLLPQVNGSTFFDGIDISLKGMSSSESQIPAYLHRELEQFYAGIRTATGKYDPAHPHAIAPELAVALKQAEDIDFEFEAIEERTHQVLDVRHELAIKSVQLQQALALALDIQVEATSSTDEVVAATLAQVHIRLSAPKEHSPDDFFFVAAPNWDRASPCAGPVGSGYSLSSSPFSSPVVRDCIVPESNTAVVTRPYFTRANIEQPVYQLLDPQLRNAPLTPPALVLLAEFHYRGARLEIDSIVQHGLQPVQIVPALSISLGSHALALPSNDRSFLVRTTVEPSPANTNINIEVPTGWQVHPHPQANPLNEPNTSTSLIEVDQLQRKQITLSESVDHFGAKYTEGYRPVGYGDLPRTNYYTPAIVRVVPVDLNLTSRHRIAYLPGTGDAVPEALASIGLAPTLLTVADLTSAKLAQFDTVILGVRTYNAHPDLHGAPTQALLDYARNGGNVIVQFQTGEFTAADAPFPLTLGYAEKVVDETAPVQLLDPTAPFFTTPNRITSADFNGWVEERGHGFLRTWDSQYTALTETHDPGQAPQRGGLVTTTLGKGHWTYCAFALYRQLPEAVPGAFRLFANLLNP
ncbi:MAG: PIG-L family deacetylase [Acidobacteriaceae bacterium]